MPIQHRLANTGTLLTNTYFDEYSQFGSNSYQFNGSTGYLSIPNLGFSGKTFQVETWFYLTGYATVDASSSYGASLLCTSPGSGQGIQINLNGTASSWTGVSLYGNNGVIASTLNSPYSIKTWNHIAVTHTSGGVFTVYLNGNSIGTVTNASTWADGTNNYIGSQQQTNYIHSFPGYLSNYRILINGITYTTNFVPPKVTLTSISNTSLLLLGNNFKDYGGNNVPITVNGGVTLSTFSPFSTKPHYTANNIVGLLDEVSNLKGSIYFPSTGYVTWSPGATAAFGTGPFTIEMWIYLNTSQVTSKAVVIDFRNSGQTSAPALVFRASGVTGALGWYTGSGYGATDTSTTRLGTGVWHHIAYCRSGTTGYLFVDGNLVNSTADGTNYTVSPTISYIAASYVNPALDGNISNLRIIKGTALYTANFTPPGVISNVANTVLLLNTTPTQPFIDSSSSNKTITVAGTGASANTLTPSAISGLNPSLVILSNSVYRMSNSGTLLINGSGQFDEVSGVT